MKESENFLDISVISLLNKMKTILPYATILAIILAILISALENLKIIIIIVSAILLIAYTSFSLKKLFFIFAFYIITFEESGLSVYFPGIPITYRTFVAAPIFLLLLGYWIIHINYSHFKVEWQTMEKAIATFLIFTFISTIYGLMNGYLLGNILEDCLPLLYFCSYFIVTSSLLGENYKKIYEFFLICSVLISLQFIYAISIFKGSFFLTRIVSQHIHMAQFAVPFLGTTLIYADNQKKRLLCLFLLPFIFAGVIISQQRALWLSIFLTTLTLLIMLIYHYRKQILTNINRVIYIVGGIIIVCILSILLIGRIAQTNVLFTMLVRSSVFLSPKFLLYDESAVIRINELKETIEENKNNLLLGSGLGAVRITRWRDTKQLTVDNSYIYLLWKMGILGLSSFLFIYLIFFKHAFLLLSKPLTADEKIILISTILNFAGMFIIALTNASIAHYRFIFVWSIMIAAVESLYRKYA